jgi:hypothetical protein
MTPAASAPQREIIRADPALRRQLVLVLLLVCAIGLFAAGWVPEELATILAIARESPGEARLRILLVLGALIAPPVLLGGVAGIDAIRRAVQTIRADQHPPPGARVFRDTPVIRGRPARILGVVAATLGVALLVLCSVLPVLAFRLGAALERGCPRGAAAAAEATDAPAPR